MTRTPARMIETPSVPATPTGDPYGVVSRVLDLVRLSGAIFFRSDFSAPWSYLSPNVAELETVLPPSPGSLVMFHIVVSGRCWVAVDGRRREVSAGDVVVMPYGDPNLWGSLEPADPVPIMEIMPPPPWTTLPHLKYGGSGEATSVVCGYLRGDAILFDPVLRALPPLFVVRPPDGPARDWLNASVQYAMFTGAPAAGAPGSLDTRLPESLFAEVLRQYLTDGASNDVTGWLAALRDPVVGPAVARLHAEPARAWTVRDLAMAVAVSRTVLVEGFVRLLGRPPIRYLTEWRLRLASGLLSAGGATVAEAAEAVGYTSEAAFSRAFKREFGEAPAHWRARREAGR